MSRRVLLPLLIVLFAAPLAAQTAFISGTVYGEGGQPLNRMTVAAYGLNGLEAARTETNQQGQFTLAMPAGKYRILAYDNTGTYATTFYPNANSFDRSAILELAPGSILNNVTIVLVRGVKLSGRVDSGMTGGVLANAVVSAYNLDGTRRGFTRTNSAGMFTLVLPPGDYKLVAWDETLSGPVHAPQFYANRLTFESADVVTARVDQGGFFFSLVTGSRITGRVFDKNTGAPIAGATVIAYDQGGLARYSATTDQNGLFSMIVASGTYKLVAADAERKYTALFYRDATSFGSAASVTVIPPNNVSAVDFALSEIQATVQTILFVPGVANTPGQNNTYFQSDVWIYNPSSASSVNVTITYLPEEQDNSSRTGINITIPPRQQIHIANVLQQLFGVVGKGGLRFEAVGQIRVVSRTYNNPPNAPQVGTHGLSVPALALGDSIGRGVITGLVNNSNYRSNVGVLNPHNQAIDVTYVLFSADGTQLGSTTRTFRPLEFFQASTIFAFLNVATTTDNAYLILSSTDASFFAYGSVVDQKSGDGTYVNAIRD